MDYIDTYIKEKIASILSVRDKNTIPNTQDYIETDNLGEVLEKLIIVHIRMWMIEDLMQSVYDDDSQVADLKRKLDICFKQKRPKLVQAINRLIELSISNEKSLIEDSVKIYKGLKDKNE